MACRLKKERAIPGMAREFDVPMICHEGIPGGSPGCVEPEPEIMQRHLSRQQLFRLGKSHMQTYVQLEREAGTWTPQLRDALTKRFRAMWLRARHKDGRDPGSSFYAGALSTLKSGISTHFSEPSLGVQEHALTCMVTLLSDSERDLQEEDTIAPTEVILPLSVILGFCLLNLLTYVGMLGLIEEVVIIVGVTCFNRMIERVLFFLSGVGDEELEEY